MRRGASCATAAKRCRCARTATRARWRWCARSAATGTPTEFSALTDPRGTRLERLAQRGRHGIDDALRILDAVRADLEGERRGTQTEAGVAAADGAGGDIALALEAAVALEVRPPARVAPVDHHAVL